MCQKGGWRWSVLPCSRPCSAGLRSPKPYMQCVQMETRRDHAKKRVCLTIWQGLKLFSRPLILYVIKDSDQTELYLKASKKTGQNPKRSQYTEAWKRFWGEGIEEYFKQLEWCQQRSESRILSKCGYGSRVWWPLTKIEKTKLFSPKTTIYLSLGLN